MPFQVETFPIGEFAEPAELIYDTENPFWFPRFTIHGGGTPLDPYMVCDGPMADCSPCSRARKRKTMKTLKQGSQEGGIN